jgi:cation transport ATPase
MPRVAHRKRGTEIEDINLDQVKIGDTILILHFSSQLCPVHGVVSEARGVMDTLASD